MFNISNVSLRLTTSSRDETFEILNFFKMPIIRVFLLGFTVYFKIKIPAWYLQSWCQGLRKVLWGPGQNIDLGPLMTSYM